MEFGGPVWHVCVSGHLTDDQKVARAMQVLGDLGDTNHQWIEINRRVTHVRRRATPAEEELVGGVLDCRGTGEWTKRYHAIVHKLPEEAKRLAMLEMLNPKSTRS